MKGLMTLVMGLILLPVMAVAASIHVPADELAGAREATLGFPKIMLSDTAFYYTLFARIFPPDSPAPCEGRDTIWVWNAGTDNLHLQLSQSHLPRQTYVEFITPLDSNVILPGDSAAIEIRGCHDGIGGSDYTDKCVYSIPGEYEGYLEITSNDPLDSVVRVRVTRSIPNPMLPSISVGTDDVFYTHFPNIIGYSAQTFCGGNPPIDIEISCGQAPTWYPYYSGGIPFWTTTESDSCVITLRVTDQLGRTASATTYVKVVRQYNGPVWYVSPGGDDQTGVGSESSPFRTLQMGITTADPGDTVVAGSGAYDPVVIGKPLTLIGRNGAESTEIMGLPNARCVFVNSVVDTVVVDGFTLRNGFPPNSSVSPFGQGGGLLSVGSNVRIANCIVSRNGSTNSGGGLAFRDSSYFEIINTRISANSASQSGGGIVAIDAKGCKISNTVIDSNEANLNGGGVFIYSSSVNPTMNFELKNCVIAGNTAHEGGTGIGVRRNSLSMLNCIVYANHAASPATSPSGVYVSAGSLSLHCSDLYVNDQANLFAESISDSSGNISLDPLFCDPTVGNFHISQCSPCVSTSNGCGELIGSDSADCDSGCPPSSLTWHVAVDGSDLTGNGTSAYPFATIQRAIDMSEGGDTVLVAPGNYSGNFLVVSKSISIVAADSLNVVISPIGPIEANYSIQACDSVLVSGFFFSTWSEDVRGHLIQVSNNSRSIFRRCRFVSGGPSGIIRADSSSCVDVRGCLFKYWAVWDTLSTVSFLGKKCKIINNTFHGGYSAIHVTGDSAVIMNNVVYDNSHAGLSDISVTSTVDYNDVWNNGANYVNTNPGPHNISENPEFECLRGIDEICDYAYYPPRWSPCHDAGNPSAEFIDPDGSRNDVGAFHHSNLLYVPDRYPTLRQAFLNVLNGDSVIVRPGVYYESSYYEFGYTRDIWIVGEAGADSTILNPADSGTSILSLVASGWGEIRSSYHISGLTFQGSLGASALHLTHTQSEMASFVVSNCRFINNSAPQGAGVFLGAFGGYERRDSLSNNVFEYNSGGRGTGICLGGTGAKQSPLNPLDTLVVLGNRFVYNSGVSIFQVEFSPIGSPALKVIENLFQGNTADSTISEGGNEWSNWIGNRWIGNKVNGGGTIHNTGLARHHNFYVSNSFVGNEFVGTPGTCLLARGRHLHLDRNLCVATRNGTGIVAPDTSGGWWTIEITCNNSWGNTFENYVCVNLDTSNLSLDPEFCDAANGDFQVKQSSPCAPSNNGCGVLIGALGIGCLYGDADGDGSVTIADVVFLINYIFMGGAAPQPVSLGDADCSGSINIADCVYLINYVFSHGPAPCALSSNDPTEAY